MARPPGRPRARPIDEQRRLVLDAATSLFAEHGYAATTLDAIATAAGCSRASLHDLMGGKADLFAAVVDRMADDLLGELEAHYARLDDYADRSLEEVVRADVHFAVSMLADDPRRLALVREADQRYAEGRERGRREIEDHLAEAYRRRAAELGVARGESTRLLAAMTTGAVWSLALRAAQEPSWPRDLVVDWLTRFIVGGLLLTETEGVATIEAFDRATAQNDRPRVQP